MSGRDTFSHRGSNSTAERALAVLELFTDERGTITAVDVEAVLDVGRSTAYRYLQSLASQQFLEAVPGGGFRLGLRVLELARIARRSYGLSDAALPLMKELAQEYGVTVLLTRRAGDSIVCVEREESSRQYLRLSYERGTLLPMNSGASALAVLSNLSADEIRAMASRTPLTRMTSKTITNPDALAARLVEIREAGYCISTGEVDPDVIGIAVPIVGPGREVLAGLSVVGLQNRIPDEMRRELVERLMTAAESISRTVSLAAP